MKKKRILYSELTSPRPAAAPAPELSPELAPELAPEPVPQVVTPTAELPAPVAPPDSPAPLARPRRASTPVELARALAAARALENAAAGIAEPVVESVNAPLQVVVDELEPARPIRERARLREGRVELLVFCVGHERFGVELSSVEEVIDLPVVHHVPEMPPAMLGVISVRGSLTPTYSPHAALGLPVASGDAALIFRRSRASAGIVIDDVDDAVIVDLAELRDAPGLAESGGVILGVIRHDGVLLALVDADVLISACQAAPTLETA